MQAGLEFIEWFQSIGNVVLDYFFVIVTQLGSEYFYIIVLGVIYWAIHKRFGEVLAVTLSLSLVLNNVIKAFVGAPRPFEVSTAIEQKPFASASGTAFPSGHTQGAASILFALALRFKRVKWFVLAAALTVLVGFSRLYLGVHFIEDVLAGGLLGMGVAFSHAFLFRVFSRRPQSLLSYYSTLALVFLPGLFLFGGGIFEQTRDFFISYGLMVGAMIAISQEKRHVDFSVDVPVKVKFKRVLLGFLVVFATMEVIGFLFSLFGAEDSLLLYLIVNDMDWYPIFNVKEMTWIHNLLGFVRYFLVAYMGFFIYPGLFYIMESERNVKTS